MRPQAVGPGARCRKPVRARADRRGLHPAVLLAFRTAPASFNMVIAQPRSVRIGGRRSLVISIETTP
jgi:hypothetical protein